MTLVETAEELTYTLAEGTRFIVQKDEVELNVQQITPVDQANGQTWQTLKTYLDAKMIGV